LLTTPPELFVGIDVSKDHLDLAIWPNGPAWRAANDDQGAAETASRLRRLAPSLVVLEATANYGRLVFASLWAAGIMTAMVNPRQTRAFAKSIGKTAKTDAIDARVLAQFAATVRPPARQPQDETTQELQAILGRRRQLIEMLTAEKNRFQAAPKAIRPAIRGHTEQLERWLADVDADLRERIEANPFWRAQDQILQSTKGVGPVLSVTLIADLPELGRLSHKEIGALVGVAPLNRDSGRYRGQRKIWGGRAKVRTALFMATRSAVQWNPQVRSLYLRLLDAGKPELVAIVACMRKLLTILNAMIRHQTPWQPLFGG
jgi:transposase